MRMLIFFGLFLFNSCKEAPLIDFQEKRELQLVSNSIKPSDIYGGKVDILWVVDNSGSMGDEQASLQKNFSLFIKEFTSLAQADWKMGLISTEVEEDPYLGFSTNVDGEFNYMDLNPEKRFIEAVGKLGLQTYDEREMGSVVNAFDTHPDFLRPGAYLAIIFLTDEPDHSKVNVTDFNDYLLDLKNNNKRLIEIHGGFTAKDLNICSPGETWNYVGSSFENMINYFNGSFFDLCSKDFGTELAQLGKKIAAKLQYPRILLKDVPFLCTIKVYFKGEKLPPGKIENGGKWFFDEENNSVVFYSINYVDSDKDLIKIEYVVDDGYPSPDDSCIN